MKRILRSLCLLGLGILLTSGLTSCASEIATQHYLGVFDPQSQVTQELYKVEIRGYAGGLNRVDYHSGWVPADAADLMTKNLARNEQNEVTITGSGDADSVTMPRVRHFYEVGPLGVSTAPDNGRFAISMGSDPGYFFRKISAISGAQKERAGEEGRLKNEIKSLQEINAERIGYLTKKTDEQKRLLKLQGEMPPSKVE